MAYTKTTWVNGSAPAINATNLNKVETGIKEAHDNLASHKNESMPHQFVDGATTYRWGLSAVNGVVMFNYEEVV